MLIYKASFLALELDLSTRPVCRLTPKKAVGFAIQAMEALLGRALPVPNNANVIWGSTIIGEIAPSVWWREVIEKSVAFGGAGRGWEGLPEVKKLIVKQK